MDARWWKEDGSAVVCELCFRGCRLTEGMEGACGVRALRDGTLRAPWLGRFCARAVDPIEKKPLHHWRPGSFIYSLGSMGCNMDCPFCQNAHIARPGGGACDAAGAVPFLPPQELAADIRRLELRAMALTYNEPTLQAEYLLEAAPTLREAGVAVALVTNGTMSEAVARELMPCVDAANVDLKGFTQVAYQRLGGSLEAVKRTITLWVQGSVHVELAHLAVPGINDDLEAFAAMADWIAGLSHDIPLHITRYFPARHYAAPPTNIDLLRQMADIAKARLRHVYLGNV